MAADASRALVLEDTELGRWALCKALESEGFQVQTASTWAEASACLLREQFGLALVAVSSILENAVDTVTSIGRDHPDTHVILLADQDNIDALRAACHATTDILTKPFDPAEVAQVALGRRPAAPRDT